MSSKVQHQQQRQGEINEVWNISRKHYSQEDRHQLWGTSKLRLTTYCWMSLILRNGEQEVVLFDSTESTVPRKTINIDNKKDIIHSERIVLGQMEECLAGKMPDIFLNFSDSSILDLAIWITNSPCIDCRDIITAKLKYLQQELNPMNLRLILFFSNLFCDRKGKPEETLDSLKDWLLSLIEMKVSVILGPIIVSGIVPKPKEIPLVKTYKIQIRKKKDIHSLTYMRKIKRKILSTKSSTVLNLVLNHEALSDELIDDNIFAGIPVNGLVFFSLTQPDKHHLSKLTPIMGLFVCLFICFFVCFRLSQGMKELQRIPNKRISCHKQTGQRYLYIS